MVSAVVAVVSLAVIAIMTTGSEPPRATAKQSAAQTSGTLAPPKNLTLTVTKTPSSVASIQAHRPQIRRSIILELCQTQAPQDAAKLQACIEQETAAAKWLVANAADDTVYQECNERWPDKPALLQKCYTDQNIGH